MPGTRRHRCIKSQPVRDRRPSRRPERTPMPFSQSVRTERRAVRRHQPDRKTKSSRLRAGGSSVHRRVPCRGLLAGSSRWVAASDPLLLRVAGERRGPAYWALWLPRRAAWRCCGASPDCFPCCVSSLVVSISGWPRILHVRLDSSFSRWRCVVRVTCMENSRWVKVENCSEQTAQQSALLL